MIEDMLKKRDWILQSNGMWDHPQHAGIFTTMQAVEMEREKQRVRVAQADRMMDETIDNMVSDVTS